MCGTLSVWSDLVKPSHAGGVWWCQLGKEYIVHMEQFTPGQRLDIKLHQSTVRDHTQVYAYIHPHT